MPEQAGKQEVPLPALTTSSEQMERIHLATHSPKVAEAVADFFDDMGSAPTVGAWKRARSS